MRQILQPQIPIVYHIVDHIHSFELAVMSKILDEEPTIAKLVFDDLTRSGRRTDTGRDGMTAEQVIRAIIIKQMNAFSYQELAFHLADSRSYRAFCRFGINDKAPSRSTLQYNIKKIGPETLEAVNQILVRHAKSQGVEHGRKVRVDCTGVETNIHAPTDSSLLWDCVRVLVRLMHKAKELVGFSFTDHSRRAKYRFIGIINARAKKRTDLYRDLLKVTHATVDFAKAADAPLMRAEGLDLMDALAAQWVAQQLRHFVELTHQVIAQTERRVLNGESVPAADKLFSIFETHTDIIKKDRRDSLYGHKLCLSSGASGLVTDCVVEDGNPADSTLAVEMIQRHKTIFDFFPRQAAFDGGFASKTNLAEIKGMGVEDVSFSKRRGLQVSAMVKSSWVYKRLKRFRAGIEGVISFLKRCFGLRRCTWRSLPSFKAYIWSSVISANLLIIARHKLS